MDFILMLFDKYGLLMIFLIIMFEYACFPIPSELVLPFLGYVSNYNFYNLFGVIIMSVIVGYIGSLICYLVGYYGGSKIYNKIYNKIPKWRKGLDASHGFFYKYGNISVMVGRVIPMFRTYVSFFAGLFKQSLFKYSLYSIVGITVWNAILITLGYYLSYKWELVESYYEKYKILFLIIIITLLIIFLIYKVYKKIKNTKTINGD